MLATLVGPHNEPSVEFESFANRKSSNIILFFSFTLSHRYIDDSDDVTLFFLSGLKRKKNDFLLLAFVVRCAISAAKCSLCYASTNTGCTNNSVKILNLLNVNSRFYFEIRFV